ncbi:glycosyltransferase [Flavobacterium alvei]|uniref:Glycosyltransferase n=1 Tax=Flavobacterium alvei TaxID=2080416 RepID=A0A2S5AFK6_9FLAO|nr:glycosyltransferase family 2 protein [Flavobacterium alvei]POY41222.1 glycosyltransferase [Flavobacterium alvei]
MPKLSIITINYNHLEGMKRTMESVANQTWQEFEYVVIDGGSTDGSAEYIESQSANINYWVSEPDKGIYNAMNKGIAKATGEYLLFLNSGDHLYRNTVLEENQKNIGNYDLVYFNLHIRNETVSKIVSYPEKLNFSHMYVGYLPHPATFIKRTLFEIVGLYDENLEVVSDWKFFILAVFKYKFSYMKISETISTYYLDGISSIKDCSEERNKVLEEYFSDYNNDYKELVSLRNEVDFNAKILRSNRVKMLLEIEKSILGKKLVSIFFRIYLILFSDKKIKDIL